MVELHRFLSAYRLTSASSLGSWKRQLATIGTGNKLIPVENVFKDKRAEPIETNIPQIHHQCLKLALLVLVSGEISLGCLL